MANVTLWTLAQGPPWRGSCSLPCSYFTPIPHPFSIYIVTKIPSWRPLTSKNSPITRRVSTLMSYSVGIKKKKLPDDHVTYSQSQRKTLRELCGTAVPQHILQRVEELGYLVPTDVQEQALPVVLSGLDCIIHAQTGSGKTLLYLLAIFAAINARSTIVQALIVVPTRELGMQVTKVARALAAGFPSNVGPGNKGSITVMTLLDGGTLKRQKSWLKAEPPQIMVATLGSLCQLLEKDFFRLDTLKVLVIDEVDLIFGASKQSYLLRKLLTSYTSFDKHQTIFASASIPQHRRFIENCIQHKWTKRDVIHVHVHPIEPMPSRLSHRYVTCQRNEKLEILVSLLEVDTPMLGIIFVNKQSENSKRAGLPPATDAAMEHLTQFYSRKSGQSRNISEILLLEENMNFNARTASLSAVRQGSHLLIATDLAARGLDLPETTHIYNFDLPKSATDYLHRAGRTGRKPFSKEQCKVTNLVTTNELFVLERIQNELSFTCQELTLKC